MINTAPLLAHQDLHDDGSIRRAAGHVLQSSTPDLDDILDKAQEGGQSSIKVHASWGVSLEMCFQHRMCCNDVRMMSHG